MGLYLLNIDTIAMFLRRRRYGRRRHPVTLWGLIFLVAAWLLIWFVKGTEKKTEDKESAESRRVVHIVAIVIALIFIVLSSIADIMGDDK
ncbi:MAG: hypothetical protein IKK66_08715 [Ruminococcus sp.]|nr:hypothetical protein [Ruminococcus sp.]